MQSSPLLIMSEDYRKETRHERLNKSKIYRNLKMKLNKSMILNRFRRNYLLGNNKKLD